MSDSTCLTCGKLPAELTANTGRDEHLPDAVDALKRFQLDRSVDVLRCPACGALFVWRDVPQCYGSGNLDEETLSRLPPNAAAALQRLFDGDVGGDEGSLLGAAFAEASTDVVIAVIQHLQKARPDQFEQLLPALVARFLDKDRPTESQSLYSLLLGVTQGKPVRERCELLVGLLRSQPLEGSAQHLLGLCETALATFDAGRR